MQACYAPVVLPMDAAEERLLKLALANAKAELRGEKVEEPQGGLEQGIQKEDLLPDFMGTAETFTVPSRTHESTDSKEPEGNI